MSAPADPTTRTEGARISAWAVAALFLATLLAVPLAQLVADGVRPDALVRLGGELADGGVVAAAVRPLLQAVLTRGLRVGNERVLLGRGGWLFRRTEVARLIQVAAGPEPRPASESDAGGPPPAHPDPLPAILDFARQLHERDIALVVIPAPGKASMCAAELSARLAGAAEPLHDRSLAAVEAALENEGVPVFDPAALLWSAERRAGKPLFLASDTHWRPEGMALVARELARFVEAHVELPPAVDPELHVESIELSGAGDLGVMLALPGKGWPSERAAVGQVLDASDLIWRPSLDADVLLLGDSFTNIYSYAAMGWGESAGFAEHLSLELRRPLDVISRNGEGSWATREALSRDLAKGRDRLAGKRLVIWEFAARQVGLGDWPLMSLALGKPPARRFLVPPPGTSVLASGTIAELAPIPRPSTAPYADYVVGIHLVDITTSPASAAAGNEALVFMWAMRNRVLLPAAHFHVGQSVTLRLRPWSDVADDVGYASRGELFHGDLMLQEPCWGESPGPATASAAGP
jgi:hypothetical protein